MTDQIIITIDNEVLTALKSLDYGTKEQKLELFHVLTKKIPYQNLSVITKAEMLFTFAPLFSELPEISMEITSLVNFLLNDIILNSFLKGNVNEPKEQILKKFYNEAYEADINLLPNYWGNGSIAFLKQVGRYSKDLANWSVDRLIALGDYMDIYELAEVIKDNKFLSVKNLLKSELLKNDNNVQYLMRQFPDLEKYRSML